MSGSASARSLAGESLVTGMSRRLACTMLGFGAIVLGQRSFAADTVIESALAEQYALMRRAYQTGDAELLRQFYSNDVVLATEGSSPIVGLEAITAGHAVLAKRRDISVELLRVTHSVQGDAASHFAKLVAYPRDPAESPAGGYRDVAVAARRSRMALQRRSDSYPGYGCGGGVSHHEESTSGRDSAIRVQEYANRCMR